MDEKKARRQAWLRSQQVRVRSVSRPNAAGDGLQLPKVDVPEEASLPSTALPAPQQLDRHFIVDSGASFHMVSWKHLSQTERDTVEKLEKPQKLTTAKGPTTANYSVRVPVKELDNHVVRALILEHSPCLLSLGQLCLEVSVLPQCASHNLCHSLPGIRYGHDRRRRAGRGRRRLEDCTGGIP